MNPQDLHSPNEIWIADGDLAIKAARAQKCQVDAPPDGWWQP